MILQAPVGQAVFVAVPKNTLPPSTAVASVSRSRSAEHGMSGTERSGDGELWDLEMGLREILYGRHIVGKSRTGSRTEVHLASSLLLGNLVLEIFCQNQMTISSSYILYMYISFLYFVQPLCRRYGRAVRVVQESRLVYEGNKEAWNVAMPNFPMTLTADAEQYARGRAVAKVCKVSRKHVILNTMLCTKDFHECRGGQSRSKGLFPWETRMHGNLLSGTRRMYTTRQGQHWSVQIQNM